MLLHHASTFAISQVMLMKSVRVRLEDSQFQFFYKKEMTTTKNNWID